MTVAAQHSLEARAIVKRFGAIKANDGVDFSFRSSEVHALLGENGAGKSTLIKIFAAVYTPDSGTILIDGVEARFNGSPVRSREAGISVVHQESMLVPRLTVLENAVLQDGGLGRPNRDLGERLVESGKRLGFDLDLQARVETLTPGGKQRVEVARALMTDAQFVILDEPTSVLTQDERATFFRLLRRLADQGLGVLFVTHNIGDALRHSDRVTVLRAGRPVGSPGTAAGRLTDESLIRLMVGQVDFHRDREQARPGEEIIRVTDAGGRHSGGRTIAVANLSVRAGEVLGVAGVEGNGQRELAAMLTGAWNPQQGSIELMGRPLRDYTPRERERLVADVPDDPALACAKALTVWQTIGLSEMAWQRAPTPRVKREIRRRTAKAIQEFEIKPPSADALVGTLSGGNRLRVVLAREFAKRPALAVLAFATKGLDVRAIEQIKRWTRQLAVAGAGVVYICADLEELLEISDRVAVMAQGRVTGVLDGSEADATSIGRLMLATDHDRIVS